MGAGSQVSGDSTASVAEVVFDQVRSAVPEGLDGELALDSSLYDIGLDSLTRMQVLNRLEEKFGMRFSEDALFDMETCADLVGYIERKMTTGDSGPAVQKAKLISARVEVPAKVDIRAEH